MKKFRIAVDGPAGAGKSTVSRMLARRLEYKYVNTGSMYRMLAYILVQEKINLEGLHFQREIKKFFKTLNLEFISNSDEFSIIYKDKKIGNELKSEEVSKQASFISKQKEIRSYLTQIQKNLGKDGGVVMEGRDIGTVVMPDADFKFFIDASAEERGKRRYLELTERGEKADLREIIDNIIARDMQDRSRKEAPLVMADDAYLIDTTGISPEEVISKLLLIINSNG